MNKSELLNRLKFVYREIDAILPSNLEDEEHQAKATREIDFIIRQMEREE